MASTFAELFSDFQDLSKNYTEKLDVTELSFMRYFTRGIQEFQKQTEYVEKTWIVQRGVDPDPAIFIVPDDMLRIVDVRAVTSSSTGLDESIFLLQDYTQFKRNQDKWVNGYLETPTDYGLRIRNKATASGRYRDQIPIATIWRRELLTFPEYTGDELSIWYIPDLHAISETSSQWTPWYPYATNFMTNFTTMKVTPELAMFEQTFLDYALSMFIKSKGSANYKVYEQSFQQSVEWAKVNKPILYREGVADYMFAPYS